MKTFVTLFVAAVLGLFGFIFGLFRSTEVAAASAAPVNTVAVIQPSSLAAFFAEPKFDTVDAQFNQEFWGADEDGVESFVRTFEGMTGKRLTDRQVDTIEAEIIPRLKYATYQNWLKRNPADSVSESGVAVLEQLHELNVRYGQVIGKLVVDSE
jgi:hypothetical protein